MHAVRLLRRASASPALEGDAAARGELVLAAVLCGQGTDSPAPASRRCSATSSARATT